MTETATYKELRRSRSDRMVAGVCGGLGRYFDVNPVFYRVGFVVLTLLGGAGILVYGAALLVIPDEGEQDSLATDVLRNRKQRPLALAGLVLVGVAGIALFSHISFRFPSDWFWALVLVGGALVLWSQRRPSPGPPPPPPPAAAESGPEVVEPRPAPATGAPPRRQSRLLTALGVLGVALALAVVAVVAFTSTYMHLDDGVGHRAYQPTTVSALRDDYRLGIGELELDLSKLSLPADETTVQASVGIGRLHMVVPHDVTVRVKTHVSWGEATLLGHEEGGHNVRADVGDTHAQLVLDTDVGIGQVEVERAVR
jgi:phage shock protein PspC (stress-responsive transcriptional regulator)